ncbi:MAG: hypothetical protein ACFFBD_22995 [Candidatus Hodarchaeota archaeon]
MSFATDCFHLNEVMRLALQLRRKVGVKARLFRSPPKTEFNSSQPLTQEELKKHDPNRYWRIKLPVDRTSRTRFLDYLSMTPGYEVARRIFPWKFSKFIQKQGCV